MIVIDKPGTIPVHPSGRYRHNCILFLLAKLRGLSRLFVVHRLDRLTSGILILAKSGTKGTPLISSWSYLAANELAQMIQRGDVKKKYIARVKGNFPQ
jgi:23S rRNA-/tRNA-specific pseudouridylate synthase